MSVLTHIFKENTDFKIVVLLFDILKVYIVYFALYSRHSRHQYVSAMFLLTTHVGDTSCNEYGWFGLAAQYTWMHCDADLARRELGSGAAPWPMALLRADPRIELADKEGSSCRVQLRGLGEGRDQAGIRARQKTSSDHIRPDRNYRVAHSK